MYLGGGGGETGGWRFEIKMETAQGVEQRMKVTPGGGEGSLYGHSTLHHGQICRDAFPPALWEILPAPGDEQYFVPFCTHTSCKDVTV